MGFIAFFNTVKDKKPKQSVNSEWDFHLRFENGVPKDMDTGTLITEDIVQKIKALHASGVTLEDIAKTVNVRKGAVDYFLR